MPKRIVKKPVLVHRDGKQVLPRVGEVFDFTDAEVKEINALQPRALDHILIPDAPLPSTTSVKPSVTVTVDKG